MNPKIIERDQIILIGFSFFGDPFAESGGWTEEKEIGRLWSRFTVYFTDHGDRIRQVDQERGRVEIGNIDAFDGTPVLDLKAYFPSCDRVRTARVPAWASDWPEWLPEEGLGLEE